MRGGWVFSAIFDQYVVISRKRCTLDTKLLWDGNRKPYAGYRMVSLSMTLSDTWTGFQGYCNFKRRISPKRRILQTQLLYTTLIGNHRHAIDKQASYTVYNPTAIRKPCKLFASVARVCQRQLGFLVGIWNRAIVSDRWSLFVITYTYTFYLRRSGNISHHDNERHASAQCTTTAIVLDRFSFRVKNLWPTSLYSQPCSLGMHSHGDDCHYWHLTKAYRIVHTINLQ